MHRRMPTRLPIVSGAIWLVAIVGWLPCDGVISATGVGGQASPATTGLLLSLVVLMTVAYGALLGLRSRPVFILLAAILGTAAQILSYIIVMVVTSGPGDADGPGAVIGLVLFPIPVGLVVLSLLGLGFGGVRLSLLTSRRRRAESRAEARVRSTHATHGAGGEAIEVEPSWREADPGWLAEVAREAIKRLAESSDGVLVEAVRMDGSSTVEFVYRQPADGELRGLRVTKTDIANSRLVEHTPGEVAFLLVYVGILEPKSDDEFAAPDSEGIRWVISRDWLT